jgi:anti-sigma regulatory factor (Ser/Thr protein kinase)
MTSSKTTAPAPSTTAQPVIRASLTVSCEASQVRAVRKFVNETLGDNPCPELPILLASELATNSVLHSSSRFGGSMTVTVTVDPDGTIRIEMADAGGLSVPTIQDGLDGEAESGRGLHLVGNLSERWGCRIDPDGSQATWFELALPPESRLISAWTGSGHA